VREVTDSITLSAEMDSRSTLHNPGDRVVELLQPQQERLCAPEDDHQIDSVLDVPATRTAKVP